MCRIGAVQLPNAAPPETNHRLQILEQWIQAVRDAWHARRILEADRRFLALANATDPQVAIDITAQVDADGIQPAGLPERGAWVALPTAFWAPSRIAKARGGLFPHQIVTTFTPRVVEAGGSVTVNWSSNVDKRKTSGTATITVDADPGCTALFSAKVDSTARVLIRRRLREVVAAGERAEFDLLSWTFKYRNKAAMSASAHISILLGVTEGFAIDRESLAGVVDELEETVLTQLYRFANVPRTRGTAARPDTDFEKVLKNYLDRESKRIVRRHVGVPEQVGLVRRWASIDKTSAQLPPNAAAEALWRWISFEHYLDRGLSREEAERMVDAGHLIGTKPAASMVQAALAPATAAPTSTSLLDHDGACAGGISDADIAADTETARRWIFDIKQSGGVWAAAQRYLNGSLPHHAASALVAPWFGLPGARVQAAVEHLAACCKADASAAWKAALSDHLVSGEPASWPFNVPVALADTEAQAA